MKQGLVIGGRGKIGRGVVQALQLKEDLDIRVVDTPDSLFDLSSQDVKSADFVLNLSVVAESGVSKGISVNSLSWRVTVEGTAYLLDLCESADRPLIHFSTREAHGITLGASDVKRRGSRIWPRIHISEDVPAAPKSAYGRGKLISEWLCEASPLGYAIRLGTPYSDEAPEEGGGLVPTIVRKSVREGRIPLAGGGWQFRDPLHVEDIANLSRAIATLRPSDSIFNAGFGGENLISLREIASLANPQVKIESVEGGDFGFAADITRAQTLLGWNPIVRVRDRIPIIAASYSG